MKTLVSHISILRHIHNPFFTFFYWLLHNLTLELAIVNTKLFFTKNQSKWLVFKKYVIIEYFYIYWFITFLQNELHVL